MGYYSPPSASPTLDCDYLGNWTNLQNACLNDCSAIARANTNLANGFATWATASLLVSESVRTVSGSCSDSGYYNYPYTHRRKPDGTKYSLVAKDADYITSIPLKISSDTRSSNTPPQRLCTKSIYSGQTASQWSGVSSTCVTTSTDAGKPNGCVTGTVSDDLMSDERIGAGVTQHTIKNPSGGENININIAWSRKSFGEYEIKYCDSTNNNCQNSNNGDSYHNSSNYYSASRSVGRFVLVRHCNTSSKKWDDPTPYCIAFGDLSNSLNASVSASPTSIDSKSHYIVGSGGVLNASCNSGFIANPSTPQIKCQYGESGVIDTLQLATIDDNQCTRYCVINPNGTPSGSSYTELSGTVGNYFPGKSLTLTCSGKPCGSQSVEATCNSDGTWNIPTPSCRACYGCNKYSADDNSSVITTRIDEDCLSEIFSVNCMIDDAKNHSSFPSVAHGGTVLVGEQKGQDYCYPQGNRAICGAALYTCNDGTWYYTENRSHKWICDRGEITNGGSWCGR